MNLLFATAMAEQADKLAEALEGVTKEEALAGGTALGISMGMMIAFSLVFFVLRIIADWKVFTKAGVAGWKSIIPFLSDYEEFKLCWVGGLGVLSAVLLCVLNYASFRLRRMQTWLIVLVAVAAVIYLVLTWIHSQRLSKAFGKGVGFGIGLFLLGPIFRLILGFGSANYVGHPDK